MSNHTFILNGSRVSVQCDPSVRVLWVLRDLLGVTGPKYGCGLDVCKACTSHLNGKAFHPCSVAISQIKPADRITTIEGLAASVGADLHPMQQAWIDHDVSQCGYCQPGQIMTAVALVDKLHTEGRQVTNADLDGLRNVCRCGTYYRIREAITAASGTPGCPVATGRLRGNTLGQVKLGMTRQQVRDAYPHSSNRPSTHQDTFCLTPAGIRVGYPTPALLKTLPHTQRTRLQGRAIWAATTNTIYTLHGVRAGQSIITAHNHLKKLAGPIHIAHHDYYLTPNGAATAILKTRHGHGTIQEIGIANKTLTHTHKEQTALLKNFG